MPIAISDEQLALQASIRDWAKRADTLARLHSRQLSLRRRAIRDRFAAFGAATESNAFS